jgi:Polyketide cyclase / dehydrase and lipid transport
MKLIIKVFGVLVGLWVILVLVGFLLPGHYRVERSIVINARPAAIYPLVADLKAWRTWGVWFARDPDMKISYSPATTEVGAWSQWTSKSQGDGKMTISAVHPNDDFEYTMEFSDIGLVSRGTMALLPGPGGGTSVTMAMDGDLGRKPLYRWFGVFMNKLVGPDFEAGLANLKRVAEAQPR